MLDLSTLSIMCWPNEIPLWAVDRGIAPQWLLHVWLAHRTDLRWIDVTFEQPNGAYSTYACIMYPDGTCEKQAGGGHHVAWRRDKRATYLQPLTYPGQLKPLVIDLSEPEVVQCEMF